MQKGNFLCLLRRTLGPRRGPQPNAYCNICNPFQYANDIMSDPVKRAAHIQDTTNLHEAIKTGTLPAIAFAKPDGIADGHPASSKLDIFEGFVARRS